MAATASNNPTLLSLNLLSRDAATSHRYSDQEVNTSPVAYWDRKSCILYENEVRKMLL